MIKSPDLEGYEVVDVHKVRLPIRMFINNKVEKPLNLNIYRNLHHYSLNKQKQQFHEAVKPLLKNLPKGKKVWLHYTIYASRNGRLDTMNVGSILDKYFSDTLTECSIIPDDDYEHVVFVSFSFGGVRKYDGHAVVSINYLEEEKPMRVILDQTDIQLALDNHVQSMGLPNAIGVSLSIEDDNIVAEVNFGTAQVAMTNVAAPEPKAAVRDDPPQEGEKTKRKRRTKAEMEAARAEEEAANAETTSEESSDSSDSGDAERTEEDASEQSGSKKGNLFGDEESQSSDSPQPTKAETKDATPEEETPNSEEAPVKRKKKSSIFDVD